MLSTPTPSNHLSLRNLVRGCLIATVFLELGLWIAMKQLGWDQSWQLATFAFVLLLAFTPILVATFLLFCKRHLTIKRMLIAIVLVSFFLAWGVVPYQRYRIDRQAGLAFRNAKMDIQYADNYLREYYLLPAKAKPSSWSRIIDSTCAMLLGETRPIPRDDEIVSASVRDTQQLRTLLAHSNRLTQLRKMEVDLDSKSDIETLIDTQTAFGHFECLLLHCQPNFDFNLLRKLRRLKDLGLYSVSKPSRTADLIKAISHLDSLDNLSLSNFAVSGEELAQLSELGLERLVLYQHGETLTNFDLCFFEFVAPNIVLSVHPRPKR